MAVDYGRLRIVMTGGFAQGQTTPTLNDTWEWLGSDWIQRNASQAPAPLGETRLGYAKDLAVRGMVVPHSSKPEDWFYAADFPAAWRGYGTACGGAFLQGVDAPWIDTTARVHSDGSTNPHVLAIGAARVNIELTLPGVAESCWLVTSPVVFLPPVVPVGVRATHRIPIPNDSALLCQSLFAQAWMQSNTSGLIIGTGGLEAVLGGL